MKINLYIPTTPQGTRFGAKLDPQDKAFLAALLEQTVGGEDHFHRSLRREAHGKLVDTEAKIQRGELQVSDNRRARIQQLIGTTSNAYAEAQRRQAIASLYQDITGEPLNKSGI